VTDGAWEQAMPKQLYIAYFTGIAGSSIGMFLIGDGLLVGADAGGIKYDGLIDAEPDGTLEGIVSFIVPSDTQLISGLTTNQSQTLTVQVRFAPGFDDGVKITRIDTPAGPINARFERLREVP
jgi:hypothetical protein